MLDSVIGQIILLKPTIITTAIGTVLIISLLLFGSRQFSWNARNVGLIGFFYEISAKECIMLALCMLKLFLVISMLFTKTRIAVVHIVFFAVLVLLYNILRHQIKEMLISIFNGAIIVGVLYVTMFLISYLRNVLFDVRIFIGLILLCIFLVLYAMYDVAWSLLNIVSGRPMTYTPMDVSYAYLATATPKPAEPKEVVEEHIVDDNPIEEYLGNEDEFVDTDEICIDDIELSNSNFEESEIIDLDDERAEESFWKE